MRLKCRHLRLRAETEAGAFGADIRFEVGLDVLWADNTKGKSTCLQGLIYALGLERMLSPRRDIPLTYVMTTHLDDPATGVRHRVLESSVWLELENAAGKIITIKRSVVGPTDRKLVTVFDGQTLTNPDQTHNHRDYFVSDPGAAVREAGFHRMLADFLGWRLPTVKRYDGSETRLYLEAIFPLFYVEQKAGWSHVPAAFPNYFQIRDVGRRSVEFVMGLETHEIELRKQQLDLDIALSQSSWMARKDQLALIAGSVGGQVVGVNPQPMLSQEDIDRAHLALLDGESWKPAVEVASGLRERFAKLEAAPLPTVQEIVPQITAEIDRLSEEVSDLSAKRNALFRARVTEVSQLTSIRRRLAAIEEDLQKNLDAQKLRKFGSTTSDILTADYCPTCAQPIADTLLAQSVSSEVMPIEDNIEYIRGQRGIFQRMQAQSEASIEAVGVQFTETTRLLNEITSRLRALRSDTLAPNASPSAAVVEERLRLEARLRAIDDALQRFEEQKAVLSSIGKNHALLEAAKSALPKERLSSNDQAKLRKFIALVREQAAVYGFSTFSADEIGISEESYRPEKEGFEIGFELSASDTIRLKWAYQLSLMELDLHAATHHPGILVFDEPRQQETKKISFKNLLLRAAAARQANQQVIFATSEDREQLQEFLSGVDCNWIPFDNFIVRKLAL